MQNLLPRGYFPQENLLWSNTAFIKFLEWALLNIHKPTRFGKLIKEKKGKK